MLPRCLRRCKLRRCLRRCLTIPQAHDIVISLLVILSAYVPREIKLRKHQGLTAILSAAVLLVSCVFVWTPLAGKIASLTAASPVGTFLEGQMERIVHRSFSPEVVARSIENLIKGIALFFTILSLFPLFMSRKKILSVLRPLYRDLERILNLINLRLSKPAALFLCCGLLGALFFIKTFGTAILDAAYTDWLMAGGDLSQHYTGWRMFRNSPWYFPLGLMDNIVYPFKESVVYTDSIPLFALFFKALSPVLPENFQYFGIFGLTVYFLQGAAAALVVQRLCKNSFYSIIASLFFIFSTAMIQRIYWHTALAAHFIILLCIYACIPEAKRSLRSNIFVWSGLFVLTVSIHIYFIPVVFVFMIACLVKDFLEDRRLRDKIITAAVSTAAGLVVMFVLGAFYSHVDANIGGLGHWSMNINALFNPQGASRFLKDLPLTTPMEQTAINGQYEGFGYLGFGVLLACFFLLVSAFKNSGRIGEALQNREYRTNTLISAALCLFFLIFALSPVVTFNGKVVFLYYIPGIHWIWSIFRSTGRYVWVLMYVVMSVVMWAAKKEFGVKKGFWFLCVLLLIQHIDLKNYFSEKGDSFKHRTRWESPLVSPEWSLLAENKKHIVYLQSHEIKMYPFLDLAIRYRLTTNDSYLSRKSQKQIEQFKDEEKIRILAGRADENAIYVFETADEAEKYREMLDISVIDKIIAGVKK
jgi:hypothetical protein